METNRLRQFRVLVETGNVRRAAELLAISHGGLSKSIKALEGELGVKLLVSQGRGIQITEEGFEVYEKAVLLLQELDRLFDAKGPAPRLPRRLRLGTTETFSTYFLDGLLENLALDVPVILRELFPGALEGALTSKQVDIGITYLPIPTPGIEFLNLAAMPMGIYTAAKAFRGQPIEELPFVTPILKVEGSPTGMKSLDGWPTELPRKVKYQVDLLESAMHLCRTGRAAIYLPRFISELSNRFADRKFELVLRPAPALGDRSLPVYLATRRGYFNETLVRRIAKAVRLALR